MVILIFIKKYNFKPKKLIKFFSNCETYIYIVMETRDLNKNNNCNYFQGCKEGIGWQWELIKVKDGNMHVHDWLGPHEWGMFMCTITSQPLHSSWDSILLISFVDLDMKQRKQ